MKPRSILSRRARIGSLAAPVLLAGYFAVAPAPAAAQGCICARQTLPILGAQRDPYLHTHDWQWGLGYRYNHSEVLYSGKSPAPGAPSVSRTQHIFDLGVLYALNEQTTLGLTLPFSDLSFGVAGDTHTSGIGDLQLIARRWLYGTDSHPTSNVSLGFGLKFPTGNWEAQDAYGDMVGGPRAVKAVDISTQPGDGGFGFVLDLQAFRQMKWGTTFLSATYLANPRDTNGTPSLLAGLMGAGAPPNARVNSVPDQYVARFGAAIPVKGSEGLSFSLAGRLEGSPTEDAFGDSNGFRFAGYIYYVEPGLTYTRGPVTYSISMPIRVHQNVQDIDTTPGADVGTTVPYSILLNYSRRIGKGK